MGQSASTEAESESIGEGLCDEYGVKNESMTNSYDDESDEEYSEDEEESDEEVEEESDGVEDKAEGMIRAPQDNTSSTENENENEEEKEDVPDAAPLINLSLLSDEDLKSHLSNYVHMTKFDIRNTATDFQMESSVSTENWYTQSTDIIKIDKSEGTVSGDIIKVSHMDLALSILKLSPEIRALRFKIVPAKLSECKFWSAVFYLLENRTPDSLGASTLTTVTKELYRKHSDSGTEEDHVISQVASPVSVGNDAAVHSIIKQKDKELVSLRQQLTKTKQELSLLQKQYSQLKSVNSPTSTHKGKWIRSQESIEFVALDEEMKEKLREGKKQRLKDVSDQMKFILDTDDDKDSSGKWNCCGETVYSATCVSAI